MKINKARYLLSLIDYGIGIGILPAAAFAYILMSLLAPGSAAVFIVALVGLLVIFAVGIAWSAHRHNLRRWRERRAAASAPSKGRPG